MGNYLKGAVFGNASWTWILFAFSLLVRSSSAASFPSLNISLGVYKQELPSPVFYETFIPVVYEYTVPKYAAIDITLRDWRERCKSESFSPSYTCPVFFHYEKYLERFEAEVVPKAWTREKTTHLDSNAPSVPKMGDDFCSAIQRHFPGSITQQYGFEEYVEKLQRCPLGEIIITRDIKDYVLSIKTLFKNMNKNYENEFSNSFVGAGNSKLTPAFYVNAVTTHQNGMLIAYLLEKNRWSEAELSCNSQLIPNSLVRVDNFTASLSQLRQLLKSHNVESSVNPAETSSFYKLPIADCSYIENNGNFVVRIQVPVRKKGLSPSLYRLESVPFVFDDDKGSGGVNRQLCQIRSDSRTFVFDKASGILQVSKCNPFSTLCKLENFASSDIVSPCISAIFSESLEGVKKYCEMDCVPWKDVKSGGLKMLPAFHQIKPDTWLVAGHPLTGVAVKCQGKPDKILDHPEVGSLEVKVPCGCYLAYQTDSYYPQSSCEDDIEPVVKHILPVHFIRDDKLEELQNIAWSQNSSENEIATMNNPDYVVSAVNGKSDVGFGAQSSAHVSEAGDGSAKGVTFIWVVFVIQLISLAVIAAVPIYKYVDRKKKLNAFSKERLVYNVYPSATASNPSLSVDASSTDTYPYSSQNLRQSITENNLNM